MELFIQHLYRHENPVYRQNNVPQAAIDFLETHVNSQLRRVDLYNMLCKEGLIDPTFIRKAQVNFWIFELLRRAYVKDMNNQLHSVKLVLEEPSMRSPTHPYSGEEAHNVFSCIDLAFEPTGPITEGGICPSRLKKPIIRFFSKHYDLNPLVPTHEGVYLSMEQVHSVATNEAYSWCKERNLSHLWAYLWNEWYRLDRWALFSRAAKPILCFGKTTYIIESHWRGQKYDYNYSFNRPRLDKLVHIIASRVLADKAIAFVQYDTSWEQPLWWLSYRT
ncbi:hypothetical protein R1flu_000396 [Riccia fluitans]|uniref:Uncharacterized protein n=1 Tax=Riccia fluitans TaxID=41844 RepID=A0ABD1Y0P3_9MARC